jgi:hypothetical protein
MTFVFYGTHQAVTISNQKVKEVTLLQSQAPHRRAYFAFFSRRRGGREHFEQSGKY